MTKIGFFVLFVLIYLLYHLVILAKVWKNSFVFYLFLAWALYTLLYFFVLRFLYEDVSRITLFALSLLAYFWLFFSFILFFTVIFLPFRYAFFVSVLLLVYGFYEAHNPKVKRIRLLDDRVPKKVKIVYFSDLHLSHTMAKKLLYKLIDVIADEKPDLVISGGDFFDFYVDENNSYISSFCSVDALKIGVLGNHEYYLGYSFSTKLYEKAGIRLLRDDCVFLGEFNMAVCGIDEFTKDFTVDSFENAYKVLVKHRPEKKLLGKGDLVLFGHTHKGQIFPFSIFTTLYYGKLSYGLIKYGSSYSYTTSGLGNWGLPIRIGAPPEVVIIEIN